MAGSVCLAITVLLLLLFNAFKVNAGVAFQTRCRLGQDLWLHSSLLCSTLLLLLREVLLLKPLGGAPHQGQVLLVLWLSMGLD